MYLLSIFCTSEAHTLWFHEHSRPSYFLVVRVYSYPHRYFHAFINFKMWRLFESIGWVTQYLTLLEVLRSCDFLLVQVNLSNLSSGEMVDIQNLVFCVRKVLARFMKPVTRNLNVCTRRFWWKQVGNNTNLLKLISYVSCKRIECFMLPFERRREENKILHNIKQI